MLRREGTQKRGRNWINELPHECEHRRRYIALLVVSVIGVWQESRLVVAVFGRSLHVWRQALMKRRSAQAK